MIIQLFRLLKGFVRIRLKGEYSERFFNLCSNRGIYLWEIEKKHGRYECNVMLKDYRELKGIARKTHTIPLIISKRGLPFVLHRNKKRHGFFLGLLLFTAIIYLLSLHIWNVSVEGGHSYTSEFMIKFLKSNNIHVGVAKNKINGQKIEELIRLTFKDIGWVSAEIKGTRLIVKITETKMPQPVVSIKESSHIVATKDCIITEIVTRTGTPLVKKGDVVKKGDILVSGVVEVIGDNETLVGKEPVIADADIIGKTFYYYKDIFLLDYIQKHYTGNEKKEYVADIMLKKINIYKPRNIYPKYDIIVEERMLHFGKDFYLPIGYTLTKYPEYIEVKKRYTKEQAMEKAKTKLERFLSKLEENDVIILENQVNITLDGKNAIAEGKIFVLESIKEYKTVNEDEWRPPNINESDGNDN